MRTPKLFFMTIMFLTASAALANGNYRHHDYIYAPVVDVQPVYDRNQDRRYERCMYENRYQNRYQDRYRNRHAQRNSGGGAVIGGLLGGLLGNRFGKGNGRRAATAAGVIIGATIGAENSKHRPRGYHSTHRNRDCNRYAHNERVIGFDVSYDYNGQIHQTFMRNHPGERVRLEVDVQVAEY